MNLEYKTVVSFSCITATSVSIYPQATFNSANHRMLPANLPFSFFQVKRQRRQADTLEDDPVTGMIIFISLHSINFYYEHLSLSRSHTHTHTHTHTHNVSITGYYDYNNPGDSVNYCPGETEDAPVSYVFRICHVSLVNVPLLVYQLIAFYVAHFSCLIRTSFCNC